MLARRDLSHHFSIATISKLFSQIQMLCIRMHDQCAVFYSTWSAKVGSIALEYDV